MEEKVIGDQVFKVMFCIMTIALVVVALMPKKVIVIGSANDNHGTITVDAPSKKRPKGPKKMRESKKNLQKKIKKKKKAKQSTSKS